MTETEYLAKVMSEGLAAVNTSMAELKGELRPKIQSMEDSLTKIEAKVDPIHELFQEKGGRKSLIERLGIMEYRLEQQEKTSQYWKIWLFGLLSGFILLIIKAIFDFIPKGG